MELAELAEKSAKFVGKKGTKIGKQVGKRGMKGAKYLGTSVKSVLVGAPGWHDGSTGSFKKKKNDRVSAFFHQDLEEVDYEDDDDFDAQARFSEPGALKPRRSSFSKVPVSDLERFWSVRPCDSSEESSLYHSSSSSDDDSDSSSTNSDGSALIKSSHSKAKELDASDRTEKKKAKKEKGNDSSSVHKSIDFAGQIKADGDIKSSSKHRQDADDKSISKHKKDDDNKSHSKQRKNDDEKKHKKDDDDKSSSKHKKKKKKSKKSKKEKKKKKPKREVARSMSDSKLVATANNESESDVDFLIEVPPPDFNRGDTGMSALSSDPSHTGFLSFVEAKDREKAAIQIDEAMEEKMEAAVLKNESLQYKLDQESEKNEELKEKIDKLENKLHRSEREAGKSGELEQLYSEVERLQMALNYEQEASDKQLGESQTEIEELKKTIAELKGSEQRSRSFAAVASVESKTQERLQGELLQAKAKATELERIKMEQDMELVNLRNELSSFKGKVGVQMLQEKLKASQEEERRLRTELDHVEGDWSERLKSKEETIEFFLKEMSRLKLQQATGAKGMSNSSRLSPEEVQNVLNINPAATTRPQLGKKSSSFAFWKS